MNRIETGTLFPIGDELLELIHTEQVAVKPGVTRDVYQIVGDPSRDVGIITVDKGASTPRQRVLSGTRTVEGHVQGQGTLKVSLPTGRRTGHEFGYPGNETTPVEVGIGSIMQWQADGEGPLVVYEICEPPYQDGRFEDLPD